MKTAGIIAEYNPFHNGHAHHISETRKKTGADFCVAVMSGSFVQRGAPALLNKYERARMALQNGIDVVIELPAVAALASAESFARGGVSLLAALGVITDLSFGAEIGSPEEIGCLKDAAGLFFEEPDAYRLSLSSYLRSGMSFPAARAAAAGDHLGAGAAGRRPYDSLLRQPNNILAVEYFKAIRKYHYDIRPCVIPRTGSGYHDTRIRPEFSSAAGIRDHLLKNAGGQDRASAMDTLRETVPPDVYELLCGAAADNRFLREDDFASPLYYALTEHVRHLDQFGGMNDDFLLRLRRQLERYESWSQFARLLKTKNRTFTSICRYFAQVLTGIRQEHLVQATNCRFAPYARVLGFCKSAAPLLKAMQEKSSIPVLMNLAGDAELLDPAGKNLLELDIRSSELYSYIRFTKSGIRTKNEYRQPLICI